MRVRMLTIESGPKGVFLPGQERTVSEELGKLLVAGRYAVEVAVKVAEIENAGAPAASETAAVRTSTKPASRARK